jgi:ABC-type multidrug transport system permease subunit
MAEDPPRWTTVSYWRQTAATGWRQYLRDNPPLILVATHLPRAILQTVFAILLCQFVGGPQLRNYASLGAVALTMMMSTTVGIADVPTTDKSAGTFWRIRTGKLSPFTVFVLRSWPYPVVGFALAVVTLAALAPTFGIVRLGPPLAPLLLCLALLALTTSAIGLAGAAFAVGRRADVLVGNLLSYLTMLCSTALVPAGRIWWVDLLGSVLPMRHGLAAIRASQAHQPFAAELGTEALVGAGWLAVAWILIRIQVHRAHVHGHDAFS